MFKNSSEFEIDITNSKKTKFYYKLYNIQIINDSIEKEKYLRTLTLPILSYERSESIYILNSDTCKIKYRNPFYQKNGRDFEYYFALSYEQDLENPIDQQNYEIKIIYNEKKDYNYPTMKIATPFYFNKYDEKYRLEKHNYNDDANLVLTFITYDDDLIANIENENMDNLESINLNKTYIRRIIDKQKIDSLIDYQVEIKNKKTDTRDICALIYYDFTNENVDINNFEKYNDLNALKIKRNENKISWNAFENVECYEIYISKDLSKVNLFNNDCYLNKLKNENNTDLKIIKETKNEYEFEKKTQKLAVTVVAVDKKYKIRFVYNSITYDYKKSYALMIILICTGSVVFIGILILVLCLCLRKKKPSQAKDYNISMSEDLNINVQ